MDLPAMVASIISAPTFSPLTLTSACPVRDPSPSRPARHTPTRSPQPQALTSMALSTSRTATYPPASRHSSHPPLPASDKEVLDQQHTRSVCPAVYLERFPGV